MVNINLINGEALENLKKIANKSINLVIIDPPYNIDKERVWDKYETEKVYLDFMMSIFREIDRVLIDNGSLYFFHNQLPTIAKLMTGIEQDIDDLTYNSFIIYKKNRANTRNIAYSNPKESNKLRCWFPVCEYILYYTKKTTKYDKYYGTPESREYAKKVANYITSGYPEKACGLVESKLGTTQAEHFISGHSENYTQYALPTKEIYEKLTNIFNLKVMPDYEEYDRLREEYDRLRPVHNLDKNHSNIMEANAIMNNQRVHSCQKDIDILRRLIRCSSNKGDLVLDCFMGSGSTGVAAKMEGRDFVGIEQNKDYFNISKDRINNTSQI